MSLRGDRTAILSIDIGTTNLKCSLYDLNLELLCTDSSKLNVLQPRDGYFEINPQEILLQIKTCIKNCINRSDASIQCIGMSTQRNSVLLWNKDTGEPFSNFVLWNDKRNTEYADSLNHTVSITGLKFGSSFLALFLNNHRFIAFSKYRYATTHVSPKILWLIDHLPKNIDHSKILFGCIETWILWKLTKEKTHVTDWTCASCSGLFDFYLSSWSSIMCRVSGIPKQILPQVSDTCGNFGSFEKGFLDIENDVPITAIIGDAQSSIIAECAFNIGDVVITIGTGAFISANCGDKPVSSKNGNYPLVGFKYLDDKIFIVHNAVPTAGIAIDWAKCIGIFDNYDQIDELLLSVEDSNGVYFVPSFSSVEVEGQDTKSAASFIGLRPTTTKAHLLRAVFDSIAFGIREVFETIKLDMHLLQIKVNSVRICGGVSRSNFFCNYLANLLGYQIQRSASSYASSSIGAAICAGIGNGIWIKKQEVQHHRKNVEYFDPIVKNPNSIRNKNFNNVNDKKNSEDSPTNNSSSTYQEKSNYEKYFKNFEQDICKWNKAIIRCKNWYQDEDYL